jgi:hypothetical protein
VFTTNSWWAFCFGGSDLQPITVGNWKSSSLGKDEREMSVLINHLHLLELMKMNKGRKSQEPANFPDGELFPIVLDEDKLNVY